MANSIPRLISINISAGGIPKHSIASALVTPSGLQGDAHDHEKHNHPDHAVCLWDHELLQKLVSEGYPLVAGSIGENFTVQNLHVQQLQAGDRLHFAGGVVLELTKPRKPCFVLDAISPQLKTDLVGRCGFLARVTTPGKVRAGESIEVHVAALAAE